MQQPLTLLRCLADVWQPGRSRTVMQSTRDGFFFPPKVRKAKMSPAPWATSTEGLDVALPETDLGWGFVFGLGFYSSLGVG